MTSHLRPTLALLVALCTLFGPAALPGPASARGSRVRIDHIERALAHKINLYRRHHGLRALRLDRAMSGGADQHSSSMSRQRYFAHASSNGGAWDARARHYSHARTVGEVIGWLSGCPAHYQPQYMLSQWAHSAPHKRVLLSRRFARFGVGRSRRGNTTYFTVDFASRR